MSRRVLTDGTVITRWPESWLGRWEVRIDAPHTTFIWRGHSLKAGVLGVRGMAAGTAANGVLA